MHAPFIMPEQVFEGALPTISPLVLPGREPVTKLLLRDASILPETTRTAEKQDDHGQRLCLPDSTQVQATDDIYLDPLNREQVDDAALSAYLTFSSKSTFKVKRYKSLARVIRDSAHQSIVRATRIEGRPLRCRTQTTGKHFPRCYL